MVNPSLQTFILWFIFFTTKGLKNVFKMFLLFINPWQQHFIVNKPGRHVNVLMHQWACAGSYPKWSSSWSFRGLWLVDCRQSSAPIGWNWRPRTPGHQDRRRGWSWWWEDVEVIRLEGGSTWSYQGSSLRRFLPLSRSFSRWLWINYSLKENK